VNFGSVLHGNSGQLPFTVVNNGAAELTVTGVEVTGAEASEFQAGTLGAGTLAPGTSTAFTVVYSPTDVHSGAATLHITSNDPVTPTFDVELTGTEANTPINTKFAAGTYVGLIQESATSGGTFYAGAADLTLVKTGHLTGKLIYEGATQAVNGVFDKDGFYNGKPAGLGLVLSSGSGGESYTAGYWMHGSVSGQNGSAPFNTYHAAYARKEAVAEAGKYTLLLSGTGKSNSIPQGTGYAYAAVAKTGGGVTMKGKLADGTAFSVAGLVVSGPDGNEFFVFNPKVYGKKGLFAGPVVFEHLTGSDCNGTMEWMRPAGGGALYPQGFDAYLNLAGSIYVKPGKGIVLPLLVDGTLTLSAGGLSAPIPEPVAVSPQGILVVTGSNPNDLKISVDTSTGGVSGSFVHPVSMKPVSFSGVLYQNTSLPGAGGFFIGPILSGTSLSGNVILAP
jgi:hypothetical protein